MDGDADRVEFRCIVPESSYIVVVKRNDMSNEASCGACTWDSRCRCLCGLHDTIFVGFQKVDDDYLFNNDFSVVVLLNDAPHVILHDNVINQNVPNSVPQAPSAKNWICTNAILKKKSSHHYSIIHY